MGFFNHNLGFLAFLLLLLLSFPFLALSLSPSPSGDDGHQRSTNAHSSALVPDDRRRQGSHVMKPRPWATMPPPHLPPSDGGAHSIDGRGEGRKRRRKDGGGRYDLGTASGAGAGAGAVFSVMLPRGFVPPSDSTWCQNDAPDAVELFCEDKSTSRP